MAGEEIETEELVILNANEQQFAFLIKVQPFVWKCQNCVKINLTDVTGHRLRELKIAQMISGFKKQSTDILADFVNAFTSQESQTSKSFYQFAKFYYKVHIMFILQRYSQGTRNNNPGSFTFRDELRKTLEHCYVKAFKKEIDFSLYMEVAIPKFISGDVWSFKMAIYCMMNIATELANPQSQIHQTITVATVK